MEAKHTKEPWTLDTISGWTDGSDRDLNGDIYIRKEGDALPFGQIFTDTEEREMLEPEIIPERIANARLIAAAPELLAALEALVEALPEMLDVEEQDIESNALDDARAAIAKAKGGEW